MVDVQKKKKPRRAEQDLQRALLGMLKLALPKTCFVFACPNGGFRSPVEAAIFKGQGVLAGVPDLVFIYHGAAYFLELKSESGSLSSVQRDCHVRICEAGARVETVRSVPEALERLREFGIPLKTYRVAA